MLGVSFRNLLVRGAFKVVPLELAMSGFLVCLFWVIWREELKNEAHFCALLLQFSALLASQGFWYPRISIFFGDPCMYFPFFRY